MDQNLVLRRAEITDLEIALKQLPDQIDVNEGLTHHYCDGLYGRELFMKAGAIWVGKIHKKECILVMLSGKVAMVNAAIDEPPDIWFAPCVKISPAGTKRALVILEDTVFLTVHPNPNNHRDVPPLEEELIAKDFQEFDRLLEYKQ